MRKTTPALGGPQFVRFFGPVLDTLRELDGSGTPSEVTDAIAVKLKIPENEQTAQMASGTRRYPNQVAWARFYLVKAELIDASERSLWKLTEKGRGTVLSHDQAIALFKHLHAQISAARKRRVNGATIIDPAVEDPTSDDGGDIEQDDHRAALMAVLKSLPAKGFEQLCQFLLRKSGFERVEVTGRSGDGGIDGHGVLQVNDFVSFRVLFQCKRYKGSVGSGASGTSGAP